MMENTKQKKLDDDLMEACYDTSYKKMEYLLDKGANPDIIGDCGETPITALIDNSVCNNELTFHIRGSDMPEYEDTYVEPGEKFCSIDKPSTYKTYHDLVTLLLENGADPNKKNSKGDTPITLSVMWGDAKMNKILLKHGADTRIKGSQGKTARQLAGLDK